MAFAATAPVLAHARCDGCPFARQAGPMTPATEKAGTRKLSLHVEQFDLEDQSGVGRNDAARTARAIAEGRRDDQGALAADLHRGNALVPAGNDPLLADRKLEWLAAVD